MSDDWVITPPCSPVFYRKTGNQNDSHTFEGRSHALHILDWDRRMFTCMGDVDNNAVFHEESYILKNDIQIISEKYESPVVFVSSFGSVRLFNYDFDKGSALLKHTSKLFKLAKASYMQLDSASKVNIHALGMSVSNKKTLNSAKNRENIVDFLLYIRNYVQRVCSCPKYRWIAETLFLQLFDELTSLRLLFGSLNNVPDYVLNYSASSAGNKTSQASYHLFHCQLDVRWLHLTLIYQLISYKERFVYDIESSQVDRNERLTFETLENDILLVMSDLVVVALKRFQNIDNNDLRLKTVFTCTCVREFWKLLQLSCDILHSKEHCMSFWSLLNRICEKIMNSSPESAAGNCSVLSPPCSYSCSNAPAFILWLLKDVAKLYKFQKQEIKSNYQLLENVIKSFVNSNVPESYMRIYLNLVESILNAGWEMRTDPLILLWEYFHKKLNLPFFIQGTSINNLAVISKSALELLSRLNSRLDELKPNRDTDSFHLFIRLLGRSLRKWQDSSRFWNQLKGRIYSKFSAVKLAALNETGLYHFVSLFLVLAMTADLHEVANKLQSFIKLLPLQDLDQNRVELIWKSQIALVLLYAERNQDTSTISSALLDMVEVAVCQTDSANVMRIFSEGFQALVDITNNLELGQYIFIGNWIPTYLARCNESDSGRLLDSLLTLINKLNSILSVQLPVSEDNQLLLLHNALWDNLVSYMKKSFSISSSPYQVSDIAAGLTTLSMKSCFPILVRNRAVELFTYFITNDQIDARLLCRYLGQTSRCTHLHYVLSSRSIILIKGWLRCLIVTTSSDSSISDLQEFTNYVITLPELQTLFNETSVSVSSHNDYFQMFLMALRRKNSSIQDLQLRSKFGNQITGYFSNTDRWLSYLLKVPKSVEITTHVYHNIGLLVCTVPQLLYTKSKANSLLQCFLDLLLLPVQVRNPQYKLNPFTSEAIKSTLHLYVFGLFKLDPANDVYICRSIRELITVYVPRLIVPKGTIVTSSNSRFSLLKCFETRDHCEYMRKMIIDVLCSSFIKRKTKTPHQYAFQTLIFFNELIHLYKNNNDLVSSFIKNALDKVCDVFMFCEEISPCKTEAKGIIHFILDMHMLRSDSELGNDLINMFSNLCHEHLAFNAKTLFDLFENMVTVAPDLVTRFMPQFLNKIKEVEHKRGVGFDRALRKGLERIEEALKNIRNKQSYYL